jgi:hypothetical protein
MRGLELVAPGLIEKGQLDGTLMLTNGVSKGKSVALLATPDGEPLVISHARIGLPRLDESTTAPPLPLVPAVRVRARTGEDVRFRYGAEHRPTEIWIDPGEPGSGRGAPGYLDLDLEVPLSVDGLELDGEFSSSHGQLAFPNGTLALRRGRAWIRRDRGEVPRVLISAEAAGRVGDYQVSLKPSGQIYPFVAPEEASVGTPLFAPNADAIPFLETEYILALLGGPVVAPSAGGRGGFADLLAIPGRGQNGGAELTGFMLPSFGTALGMQEFALDVGFGGPVRLRLGERLFRRLLVTYVSALSGPAQSSTFRVTYEVTPLLSMGWSADELERSQWEVQAFMRF